MVGDMFNTQLKAKLNALCSDIAAHLDTAESAGGVRPEGDEVSYRSPNRSDDWWPAGLGRPGAVGAQNDLRYAVFPETRRLVIDDRGTVSVYDTGHHRIFGVAQAQSRDERCRSRVRTAFKDCRLTGQDPSPGFNFLPIVSVRVLFRSQAPVGPSGAV